MNIMSSPENIIRDTCSRTKVEVHSSEPWLTLEWQKKNLVPLEAVEPKFNSSTDAFIFYEQMVVKPSVYSKVPIEKRFGLLTEPSVARPFAAQSISHVDQFRAIYTHDPLLLSLHPNYRRNLFGTSWVFKNEDMTSAPPKNRVISIITSNLSRLAGHKLRLAICRKLYENKRGVDIFGRGIPWGPYIPDRRDAIAPYLFTIAIENCSKKNYFTEKVIDPLVTRTIPIYWGCPNISDFLNTDGMIIVKNEREFWLQFERVMSDPARIYESCRQASEENCRLAIEKYNAIHAWGNVAVQIADELEHKFNGSRLLLTERLKAWHVKQAFLAKEHGLDFFAIPLIKTAMGRI